MTALVDAAIYWGGCVFWLSVVAVFLWVAATEWSVRRANAVKAARANRYLVGRRGAR